MTTTIRHALRGRVPVRTYVDSVLRARAETISTHVVRGPYPNDLSPPAFGVEPVSNCQLLGVQPAGTGAHRFTLRLPKTAPGHEVTFSYMYVVRSATPDQPYLRNRAGAEVFEASVGVQFEPGDLPAKVWYFTNETIDYEPLDQPRSHQLLTVNKVGYVEHRFPRQSAQECYGFAWRWLSDRT